MSDYPLSVSEFEAREEGRGKGYGGALEKQTAYHIAEFPQMEGVLRNHYPLGQFEIDVLALYQGAVRNIRFIINCRDKKDDMLSERELWRTIALCYRYNLATPEDKIFYPAVSTTGGLEPKADYTATEFAVLRILPEHWNSDELGVIKYSLSSVQPFSYLLSEYKLGELNKSIELKENNNHPRREHIRPKDIIGQDPRLYSYNNGIHTKYSTDTQNQNNNNADRSGNKSCKIDEVIEKYGVEDLNSKIEDKYRSGASLRDLEQYIGERIIEAAGEDSSTSDLQKEPKYYYEILTGDQTRQKDEVEKLLKEFGLNPAEIKSDFSSYVTVGKHLEECLDMGNNSHNKFLKGRAEIVTTQHRLESVFSDFIKGFSDQKVLAGSPEVTANVTLTCSKCSTEHKLLSFLDRGGCPCSLDPEN